MPKILITGCSSGFGRETAQHFWEQGWEVIATMRTPQEDLLPRSDRMRVLALDVTEEASLRRVVEATGPIDALVNNAGLGMLGVLEGTPVASIRSLFETNVFGAMALTQAYLPLFRRQGAGVIVNVSSSVTLRALPLLAAYSASKAALTAFSESLALELEGFGIRVKLVLPGRSPETAFGKNAQAASGRQGGGIPEAYSDLASAVSERMRTASGPVTRTADVTAAIWRAVTDPTCPTRLPAGADAVEWAGGSA